MTLDEKLKAVRVELDTQRSKVSTLKTELRGLVEKAETEADLSAAKTKRSALEDLKAEIRANEEKEALYASAIEGDTVPAKVRNQNTGNQEQRDAVNAFLRSKGAMTNGVQFTNDNEDIIIPRSLLRDASTGITSPDVKEVIPEDISYKPQTEVKTVVDLSQFVNRVPVKRASGKYPIRKKATSRMHTVAELEENPELSKPKFIPVAYNVETRRGAEPISQESIEDSEIDLLALIAEDALEQKVNTTNFDIAEVMKTFTAKSVNSLDALKTLVNKGMDQAYNKAIVASQTFYDWLDHEKDDRGQYLLQNNIQSASGKMVFGIPIFIIDDDLLGEKDESHAFFGDLKRAILYADRNQITARWNDDRVYGQYLQVGTRYDVTKADENAGFFLTQSDSPKE